MSKSKIFLGCVGVMAAAIACFADTIGLQDQPSAGFGKGQSLLLALGLVFILLAVVLKPKAATLLSVNMAVFLSLLILVNNLLYIFSPLLPYTLVKNLSLPAVVRYHERNDRGDKKTGYTFDDRQYYFFHGTPNYKQYDEFGYHNPAGYISQEFPMDVVLLGDSFTEGQAGERTMAVALRDFLNPLRVYSLGISAQGLKHWKHHFERYVSSPFFKAPPKVVVLNYCSGNDVTDTTWYARSFRYYKKFSPSFFREIASLIPRLIFTIKNEQKYVEVTDADGNNPKIVSSVEELIEPSRDVMYASLQEVVAAIHKVDPATRIILSYIPTTETCYLGGKGQDIHERNSTLLKDWTRQLNIEYIDPLPILQQQAQTQMLHGEKTGGHFNEEGYRVYSQALAAAILHSY